MVREKQINLRVKDGEQFFANETSINFNPTEFVIDFKCINNIQDIADQRVIILKHNIIILSPYHAKSFTEVINRAVKEYESKFGEIKKPKEVERAEKMIKKEREKKVETEKDSGETFFG